MRRVDGQPAGLDPAEYRAVRAGDRLGEFRLERRLGVGAQGTVWEAHQTSLSRRVALKLLAPEHRAQPRPDRAEHEARAAARLSHEGIVAIYDVGETEELPWICQELVPGGRTLREWITELRALPEQPPDHFRTVAELAARVAEALHAAHGAGVVHRDVKPSNVLLTVGGRPKLTDFGMAGFLGDGSASGSGSGAGTYLYMSPEQANGRGRRVDARSDVFSLGVVLYELLTLRRPFAGDTPSQVCRRIVADDPPDPRSLRSRIPHDLAVICLHALEKDPRRRYATAGEMAADLRRYLADEPIHARPAGHVARLAKWCRRHPVVSAGGGIALVTLLVVAGVGAAFLGASAEAARSGAALRRLSDLQDLEDLVTEVDDLERMWPPHPANIPNYVDWIARAEELVGRLPELRAELEALEATARPLTPDEVAREHQRHPDYERRVALERAALERTGTLARRRGDRDAYWPELVDALSGEHAETLRHNAFLLSRMGFGEAARRASLRAIEVAPPDQRSTLIDKHEILLEHLAAAESPEGLLSTELFATYLLGRCKVLDARIRADQRPRFPEGDAESAWRHARLRELIGGLEALIDPDGRGLLSSEWNAAVPEQGWSVPRRLKMARWLERSFAPDGEYTARWRAALPEIEAAYAGVDVPVQMGLVPLGPDPRSGLWEFWVVTSGEEPVRDEAGNLQVGDRTGVVLVLLPGGTFVMGAQDSDPSALHHDTAVDTNYTSPVHTVELSPFFMAKHELTQGQWHLLTLTEPSQWRPPRVSPRVSHAHPVERVSWQEARRAVRWLGLDLPTEAQWEYACRAGTDTVLPWAEDAPPGEHANLIDLEAQAFFTQITNPPEPWSDGFGLHAPVGSLRPNAFGLHDMLGNVEEWVLDKFGPYVVELEADPGQPVEGVLVPPTRLALARPINDGRVLRGGSYTGRLARAHPATRNARHSSSRTSFSGLRVVRPLQ